MASFALPSAVTVVGPFTQSSARIFSRKAFCSGVCCSVGTSAARAALAPTINSTTATQGEIRSSKCIQVLHEGGDSPIQTLHSGIGGFYDVVLIWSMRAGAVAEPEVSRRQAERWPGEHISRPRAGGSRPQLRLQTQFPVGRQLGLDEAAA